MRGEIGSILSGTMSQEMRLEILSNNMANANTVGFKEDRVFRIPETPASVWNNLPANLTKDVSINNISSLPVGTFTNFEQGQLKETGNVLDMALEGEGFFSVQTSQGMQYTRKGSFALNSNGTLVTQEGYPVLGKGGSQIQISGKQVVVGPNGAVIVDDVEVGALNIVEFANKTGLLKTGDSLYSQQNPNDPGAPAKKTVVQQRFIEGSNVDPVKMMTEMINVVRGYESYQKVLQSMNEVDTKTNEVGKLS